jgi:hypothetical protein
MEKTVAGNTREEEGHHVCRRRGGMLRPTEKRREAFGLPPPLAE